MINPSYKDVQLGDQFVSNLQAFRNNAWAYISTVVDVEPAKTRFSKPDRIVVVRIVSTTGLVVDERKPMWVSQLLQGLV